MEMEKTCPLRKSRKSWSKKQGLQSRWWSYLSLCKWTNWNSCWFLSGVSIEFSCTRHSSNTSIWGLRDQNIFKSPRINSAWRKLVQIFTEHHLVPLEKSDSKGCCFGKNCLSRFWHKQLIAIAHNYKKASKEGSLQRTPQTSYWCEGCKMVVCELDYWAYHSLKGISLLDGKLSIKF